MAGNFSSPYQPSPQFAHYENVTLLGPPTMRGAIVFSGSSHPKLVEGMCDRLGMRPGHATLGKFKNGIQALEQCKSVWIEIDSWG